MSGAGDSIRVLHVDDDQDLADLATAFLEREDDRFITDTATTASDGLARLSEGQFDCIISDYDMPDQDGIAFLEEVRESYPDLPFILYTGKGSEEVASEAISAGVTDYLQKESGPDQYTVLANRIQNAVERREAERERNRQLDAIETAQEGISILDEDGHYVYVNQRFADLHGYDPEELIGEHWELVYPDEDVPEVRDGILPEVEQKGHWYGETVSLRADGETVPVDHTIAMTDRGELVCTVRDISDRKEREQELRRKTARLEVLFEESPDMINVHDADGNLLEPNTRLCEKTGYDAAELAEMKVWDLDRTIDPDEAHALWEDMDVGDRRRFEGTYQRRDGSTIPVEVHVRRLRFEGQDRFVAIARDISDRKDRQTEVARYERLIRNLPVGVFRTTPDGDFVYVNKRYLSLFGADSEGDLEDIEVRDIWATPEERDTLLRQLEREGVVEGRQLEVETLDGESKWVETTLRMTSERGTRYLEGIVQDVTEQREQRRRLEQSETMFENAQDAMFLIEVNEEFTVEQVNPAYEEATGLSSDELSGRTPQDILGDEQGDEIEQKYRECVERRNPLEYEEELALGGDRTYWETRIAPVVIDGKVEKIVGATRNITERKRRERELERYKRIVEDLDDIATIIDPDGTITYVSPSVRRVLGYEPEELTGENGFEYQPPETREAIADAIEHVLDNPTETRTVQTRFRRADGSWCWIESTLRNRFDDEMIDGILVSSREITERVNRRQKLQRQNERLDEFASIVSHDLRNPLNVAEGRLELAREECESEHLDEVARAHDRMGTLINDLLTVAREGKSVSDTEPVDLAAITEECWDNIETANASLTTETSRTIEADERRLKQVFENLFRNSVEHGGEDVTVTVGELDDGFCIEDDGPGILEEDGEDVFEAGYSTKERGTGFGLSIVEQIVEAHDWEITVTEGSAGGTRFEITGVASTTE